MTNSSKQTDNHGSFVGDLLVPGNSPVAVMQGANLLTDATTGVVYAQQIVEIADKGGANVASVDAQGSLATVRGTKAAFVASATPGAVKSSAGRLVRVIITTLGTGSQVFYDNASAASGNVLFATAASAAVGTIYEVDIPAANGIYAAGAASTPVCSVVYS